MYSGRLTANGGQISIKSGGNINLYTVEDPLVVMLISQRNLLLQVLNIINPIRMPHVHKLQNFPVNSRPIMLV